VPAPRRRGSTRQLAIRSPVQKAYRFATEVSDIVTLIMVLAFVPEPALAVREIARVQGTDGRLAPCDLGKRSLWAAPGRHPRPVGRGDVGGGEMSIGQRAADAAAGGAASRRAGFGSSLLPALRTHGAGDGADRSDLGELTTFGGAVLAVRAGKTEPTIAGQVKTLI
jgi:hypothetical protein